MRRRLPLLCAVLAASLFGISGVAGADAGDLVVGAGRVMVVRVAGDQLLARSCAKVEGCDPTSGGVTLRLPESARGNASKAKLVDVALSNGKHVALVRVPADAGRELAVILAARGDREPPKVAFSGFVGGDKAELSVTPAGSGASISLTTRADLCGRAVVTGVRSLDPSKLEMVFAPGPDPIASGRAAAPTLVAKASIPKAGVPLLSFRGASSGRGAALGDGDLATAWVEDEPGVGTHAFVSFASSADVPMSGLDFVVGAPPSGVASPRAPKVVTLVTDSGLFKIPFPEDAVAKGGAAFSVSFASPLKTSCLAVVVDEVFPAMKGAPKGTDPALYMSEIVPRTGLDGASLDEVAASLSSEDIDKRKLALAALTAAGSEGFAATVRAYPTLNGPGRDLARRVVDPASCEAKMALYVPLLEDPDSTEVDRAHDRIRRCGKVAGPMLLAAMRAREGEHRTVFAEEAAFVAPDLAVPELVASLATLGEKDFVARRAIRHALARAGLRAAGARAFDAVFGTPEFVGYPLLVRVDVLRALGEGAARSKGASAAFAKAVADTKAFRERYLLLAPGAELAKAGDVEAAKFLAAALTTKAEPHLRARAAELGGGLAPLRRIVAAAIDDPEMRVRGAALGALSAAGPLDKETALLALGRLETDRWTAVRLAAAGATKFAPPGDPVDARIGAAIDLEASPMVRSEMLRALGERGARGQRNVVLARAQDNREAIDVRVVAVQALGEMCDAASVDALGDLALRGRAPVYEADRKLSAAAVIALARIAPADLDARVAPLLADGVPGDVRDLVKAAVSKRGGCAPKKTQPSRPE